MMAHGQLSYGEYARKQKGLRSFTGLAIVVLIHIFLAYCVVTGLGLRMVDLNKGPLETEIIDEKKLREDLPPPPPPKMLPPPPPVVAAPEVSITAPASTTNAITAITADKAPPPPPPAPVETIAKYPRPISQVPPRYPDRALEMGREGEVEIEFTIATDGSVKDAVVVRAVPEGMFDQSALNAIKKWHYTPQEVNGVRVDTPNRRAIIKFKLS